MKKSDFSKDSRAGMNDSFINGVDIGEDEQTSSKLTIDIQEPRTVRKQLLISSSLAKRLEREAKKNHTSVNNLINLILEAYLDQ